MKSADTGTEDGSEALWIDIGMAGLGKGLGGGGQCELFYRIRAPCIFCVIEVGEWIPVVDLRRARTGATGSVEPCPIGLLADPAWRYDTVTGDRNATRGWH